MQGKGIMPTEGVIVPDNTSKGIILSVIGIIMGIIIAVVILLLILKKLKTITVFKTNKSNTLNSGIIEDSTDVEFD